MRPIFAVFLSILSVASAEASEMSALKCNAAQSSASAEDALLFAVFDLADPPPEALAKAIEVRVRHELSQAIGRRGPLHDKNAGKFSVVPLRDRFIKDPKPVRDVGPARVSIRNGRIYHREGHPLSLEDGIYALSAQGELLITEKGRGADGFQHADLVHGEPGAGFGGIRIRDGWPIEMTNISAHYEPSLVYFVQVLHFLKESGIDLEKIRMGFDLGVVMAWLPAAH